MPGWGNLTISANDWANKANRQQQVYEDRHNELRGNIDAIRGKLAAVDKTTNPKDYEETSKALDAANKSYQDFIDPTKNPGVFERVKHLVHAGPGAQAPKDDSGKEIPGAKKLYPSQMKQEAEKLRKALGETQAQVAAGPLSPEQQAGVTGRLNLAGIQAQIKNYDTLNPHATPEERNSFRSTLIQRSLLGQEKPTLKLYTLPDGTKAWLDATRPDLIPPGSTAAVTETGDTRKRADFEAFKKDNPEYKGTFEEWIATQAATGRGKAPKPETLDNAYKAILIKEQSGQPLTADEKAHKAAWQIYNRETKIDPGVARAAAFGAMRYIPVVDPTDPQKVVMMRAGDAARSGVGTPASIAFKTDAAITKYMTSGQGGVNINYFNTATDHLEILRQAGEALNNGDYPAFTGLAKRFATATGDPAPTNFDSVKSAVAGELSKTFKGTGATDQEIAEINTTINNAQSPQQIAGAINSYTRLMGSKLDALKGQYTAGKSGQPNFPGSTPTPTSGGSPTGRYKHTATGPNNHKIGTNDDPNSQNAKWFDIVTGKPVQ